MNHVWVTESSTAFICERCQITKHSAGDGRHHYSKIPSSTQTMYDWQSMGYGSLEEAQLTMGAFALVGEPDCDEMLIARVMNG